MEQLKILTDLVTDRQQIYLQYNESSDTWRLGVVFNGELQIIPYSLGDLLGSNNSLDLDVRIEILSCPAARLCSYLSSQLSAEDACEETGLEMRFDGVVVGATTGGNIRCQGLAQLIPYVDLDAEDPSVAYDCYWFNSEGWVKVNDNTPTIRGELRLTRRFFYSE